MEPINYSGGLAQAAQNPLGSFMQGLQSGTQVIGLQQQQQERDLKLQAYQLQQARTQAMQAELATLSRDPSPQAIAAMSVKYPELSEQFKRSYDMMAPEAQRTQLDHATQVYAAVQSGRPDIAEQMLTSRADAMEKSGANPQQVQALRASAQWVQQHPESFKASAGLMLSSALGPEKFAATFETLNKVSNDNAMQPLKMARERAETSNINSQVVERSARLGLDRDKLTSETQVKLAELLQKNGELKDDARKLVNDNTVAATTSEQHAGQMDDLAQRLDAAAKAGDLSDGNYARVKEWFKQQTGNQEYVTALRNEYTRLRTTSVLKNLPPGPATDRDIEMASKGFPSETADAATMSSFLRGMAKLQRIDAATSTARAEWAGAVGHLGKPKTDIEIDGIKVPAGTSFTDFSRQFITRMADTKAAQAAAPVQVQQRSYMRHAGGQ